MNDKATIIINFDKISKVSLKLNDIANEINNMNYRDFEIILETLLEGWKGDNALIFDNKIVAWKSEMDLIEKDIRELGQRIEIAALSYREAELKVFELMNDQSIEV